MPAGAHARSAASAIRPSLQLRFSPVPPFPPLPPPVGFRPQTQGCKGLTCVPSPQSSCLASRGAAAALEFTPSVAPLSKSLLIEVCAGSAVLSKAVKKAGMRAIPIDKTPKRASSIKIVCLDLTKPGQLVTLLQLLKSEKDNILLLWIAPPCGTASRAREKPLPSFVRAGLKVPEPLRNDLFPDGLSHLSNTDKQKVEEANQLYEQVTKVVLEALNLQLHVAIENPTNSLYWETSFFEPLKKVMHAFFVTFHNCCHGGARPKLTSLWTTLPCLQSLEARCQNDHQHSSWKPKLVRGRMVFPTHEEASYPLRFCALVAHLLKDRALQLGFHESNSLGLQLQENVPLRTRVAIGLLPRGGKAKPLVSEFGSKVWHVVPMHSFCPATFLKQFPKGAKICLQIPLHGGTPQFADFCRKHPEATWGHSATTSETTTWLTLQVGVPSPPPEFLQRAVAAGHPRDLARFVDGETLEVLKDNFVRDPNELVKRREAILDRWARRAAELEEDEEKLHRTLAPHLQETLKGKRLLLWEEINKECGFPDTTLVRDIKRGFNLTGWLEQGGLFEPKVRAPDFDVSTLKEMAKGLNAHTLERLSNRQDPDLEERTWSESCEELQKGWVFRDASADTTVHCIGMRFGIVQGSAGKLRVIDDLSICGVNGAAGLTEAFQLHTADRLASMLLKAASLSPGSTPESSGRVFDLKSAYKQFGVSEADRNLVRIAVNEPGKSSPTFLGINALPFGAVGSVAGFLRVSVNLWFIGFLVLRVVWTAFFDDFGTISRDELMSSTEQTVCGLFDILGVKFAQEGAKASSSNSWGWWLTCVISQKVS